MTPWPRSRILSSVELARPNTKRAPKMPAGNAGPNLPSHAHAPVDAYPFPRTPHLPGSSVEDDDRTMPREELDRLCRTCEVVLQEKVDGTNVGVFFLSEAQPVCQKRAGLLASREKKQYNVFRNWVWQRVEALWPVLGTRWVLFGEWLWQTHAVAYDALPDFFLGYDLLDRASQRFATTREVEAAVGQVVALLPELWRGRVSSADALQALLSSHLVRSAYARTPPEGVYVRFEAGGELVARAKCRRPGFAPGWHGAPRVNALADPNAEDENCARRG